MPVNKCTIPEEMLRYTRDRVQVQGPHYLIENSLQAALEWLAENPISPTDEQIRLAMGLLSFPNHSEMSQMKMFARNLQRILFDTPQYPEELANLLARRPWDRDVIIEAYNVGLKEREKP
jgi:hypothetical protein